MKKFFYLVAVAAGMLFSACSNDNLATLDNQDKNWTNCFDEEGNAYLKFAVTSPTTGSTRAGGGYDLEGDDYGNYNDGEEKEMEVKNATLVIYGQKYEHDSEEAFKCLRVYDLGEMVWNKASEVWISKKAVDQIVQINENTAVGNVGLWALVILNKDNWALPTENQTFGAWRQGVSAGVTGKLASFATTGFYMTNMPYTNGNGATANTVKALYPIKLDAIYKTRDEAKGGETATTVNVERGVAKVEVTETVAEQNLNGQAYEFDEWFVDNFNPTAYNIRHCALHPAQYTGNTTYAYLNYNLTGVVNAYRFVFPTAITTGAYRTAWAVDPNYDTDAAAELTKVDLATATPVAIGSGNYAYFHENTFSVNKQTEPNTTRVIVPATFNGGDGFYTIASDPDVVYNTTDATAKVFEMLGANPSISAWGSEYIAGTVALNVLLDVELDEVAGEAAVTVSPKEELPSGVSLNSGLDWASCKTAFEALNIDDYVAAHETFTYYANGKAYYRILIKHFGDHDTPWQANAETMTSNVPSLIYGYTAGNEKVAETNFLGRYGAVRNNWYKINVTGLSKIGSATIPEISGNTDDSVEAAYIKYTINMVPWVIRTQNEVLH